MRKKIPQYLIYILCKIIGNENFLCYIIFHKCPIVYNKRKVCVKAFCYFFCRI